MTSIWLWAEDGRFESLERALVQLNHPPQRIHGDLLEWATSLYGRRGLLMVDGARPDVAGALVTTAALLPVLVLGHCEDVPTSVDVMVMEDVSDAVRCAHHITDVLTQHTGQRRYPRVRIHLIGELDGQSCAITDVSMYGVFVEQGPIPVDEQRVQLRISLSDGAIVNLTGAVVNRRQGGFAIRCMPDADMDLLLWLHLLIGELEKNPLLGDVDPFGPLFR
ncbi:MAG: hypothetical protein VX589_18165 [Myxococcota bacterium]|nr:hypothetical protein [Myxococcota bacterium]